MTDLSSPERHAPLADRFFAAVAAGDVDTVLSIYSADAVIWHNFDNVEQTPQQNAKTLVSLSKLLTNLRYDDIRRTYVDDGFFQQHVMRGTGSQGELAMPAALRVFVDNDHVTRVEEYLDPAPFAARRRPLNTRLGGEAALRQGAGHHCRVLRRRDPALHLVGDGECRDITLGGKGDDVGIGAEQPERDQLLADLSPQLVRPVRAQLG